MNLETFFEKFELFADAPGAVGKMRELVLELAVQGKLVYQDPQEISAEAFLQQIEIDRVRNKPAGRGRKLERMPPVEPGECPFDVPRGWSWARLGALGLIGSSCRVHEKDWTTSGVPFLRAREIVQLSKAGVVDEDLFIREEHYQCLAADGLIPEPDDIMITGVGTIGVSYIVKETDRFYFKDASVLIFKNYFDINPYFLRLVMQSPYWIREIHKESMGTTVHTLTIVRAKQTPIPFPPLDEQKRIVAKVDELMALCDRLEAQQQEREAKHTALARASLSRFADASTPANLDFLFHNAYTIEPADIRKAILTLAVQGRLVTQDPNDEDIEHSLARNDATRCEIARSDHRADRENQPLLSADHCWEIADTWTWRALADLVLFVDYRGKTPVKVSDGVRLLTAKNVRKGLINLFPEEFLSEGDYTSWMTRGFPKTGDVLITTEAPMGNAAVVELTERFALAQRVICFQSYGAVDSAFLVVQILSDEFQFLLDKNGTGVTAKGIKASKLKQLPIAVPPLAEQRRIVARIDQLMAQVDQLESQLATSHAAAGKLLEALVAELTKAGTTPPLKTRRSHP